MPPTSPLAARAVLSAAAVLTVIACFDLLRLSREVNRSEGDPYRIAEQVARIAPAVADIPATARPGYISDVPVNETAGLAAYLAAQYSVAPRLLVDAADVPPGGPLLGNFSKQIDYAAAGAPHKAAVVSATNAGVVIYRKEGQ